MKSATTILYLCNIVLLTEGQNATNITTAVPTAVIGNNTTTTTPSPTVYECYDHVDWVNNDYVHVTCADFLNYAQTGFVFDEPGCPKHGQLTSIDTFVTAKEACCYCGGGYRNGDLVPSYSPTITAVPTMNKKADDHVCIDDPYFKLDGITCDLIKKSLNTNKDYYCDGPAAHACCECNGGYFKSIPSKKEIDTCKDVPGWFSIQPNFDGHADCSWFKHYDPLHNFGYKGCLKYNEIGSYGLEVGDACCYCGGGSLSDRFREKENSFPSSAPTVYSGGIDGECRNVDPLWTDNNNETCEFYQESNFCEIWPEYENRKGGYTGLTACCTCNGGLDLSMVIAEGEDPLPEFYTEPVQGSDSYYEYYGKCINDPTWSLEGKSCDTFNVHDIYSVSDQVFDCSDKESWVSDEFQVPFTVGCCVCKGGYNGTLFGRSLRVGLVNDASNKFAYFRSGDNQVDGSIISFMKLLSKSAGFSLYGSYGITFTNSDGNYTSSINSCLEALDHGTIDLCLGSFWKTSIGTFKYSDSLYTDDFFLVVRLVKPKFLESMKTLVKPFSRGLWLTVIVFIFGSVLLLNLVQWWGGSFTRHRNIFAEMFSYIYFAITSCTWKKPQNTGKDLSQAEKILTISFVLFSLFVLSAYYSGLTGFVIHGFTEKEFTSINDVVIEKKKICVQSNIYTEYVKHFPLAVNSTIRCPLSEDNILMGLVDESRNECQCDAVVSSELAFDSLRWYDNNICSKLALADDSKLLAIDVAVPVSFFFAAEEWGKDILDLISKYTKYGQYNAEHLKYQPFASEAEICAEKEPAKFSLVEMSSVLVYSLILSVFGTCVFAVNGTNRLRLRRWFFNNLTENESIKLLHHEVKHLSVTKLFKKIEGKNNVSPEELIEVRNKLPDRKPLEQLVLSAHNPEYVADKKLISTLPNHVLIQVLESSNTDALPLLEEEDVKNALVNRIMDELTLRQEAKVLAMESNSGETTVEKAEQATAFE